MDKTCVDLGACAELPKGYIPGGYGFFSWNYDEDLLTALCSSPRLHRPETDDRPKTNEQIYEIISGDLYQIPSLAYEVGVLHNVSELLLYTLFNNVVCFQTRLGGLLQSDNKVRHETTYQVFLLTGLSAEVSIDERKVTVTVTPSELIPTSTNIYIRGDPEQLVTCYTISKSLSRLLWEQTHQLGRFRFCHSKSSIAEPLQRTVIELSLHDATLADEQQPQSQPQQPQQPQP